MTYTKETDPDHCFSHQVLFPASGTKPGELCQKHTGPGRLYEKAGLVLASVGSPGTHRTQVSAQVAAEEVGDRLQAQGDSTETPEAGAGEESSFDRDVRRVCRWVWCGRGEMIWEFRAEPRAGGQGSRGW